MALALSGCGLAFEAQSKGGPVTTLDQTDVYTGKFKINCQVELISDSQQISFVEESAVFSFDDLSTAKSQLVISLPPYNMVAKFVDRTETILNINATYCVNFYAENDLLQPFCPKGSAEIGENLKHGIISLPYSREARLEQSIVYQGVPFQKAHSECVLLNAN